MYWNRSLHNLTFKTRSCSCEISHNKLESASFARMDSCHLQQCTQMSSLKVGQLCTIQYSSNLPNLHSIYSFIIDLLIFNPFDFNPTPKFQPIFCLLTCLTNQVRHPLLTTYTKRLHLRYLLLRCSDQRQINRAQSWSWCNPSPTRNPCLPHNSHNLYCRPIIQVMHFLLKKLYKSCIILSYYGFISSVMFSKLIALKPYHWRLRKLISLSLDFSMSCLSMKLTSIVDLTKPSIKYQNW